jgi:hypothetical protein
MERECFAREKIVVGFEPNLTKSAISEAVQNPPPMLYVYRHA